MSELIGVIQQIVQNVIQGMNLTDKATGTVLSIDPLSVQVDMNMPPLPDAAILLTDAVKERVAPVQGGEGGTVMVSEGLKPGDKVLMLRVQRGQQYIILSRISEKTGL